MREQRDPDLVGLLNRWGGVTIAYRRRLIDSPSYTLNHEEVEKALEEGIRFAEGLTPIEVELDATGRAEALSVSVRRESGPTTARLPARTILVAAGTQPNTILAREQPDDFVLDGKHFQLLDEQGRPVTPVKGLAKPANPAVLTELRTGRACGELLRRSASVVGGQRRQGDGKRDDRLSDRVAGAGPRNERVRHLR